MVQPMGGVSVTGGRFPASAAVIASLTYECLTAFPLASSSIAPRYATLLSRSKTMNSGVRTAPKAWPTTPVSSFTYVKTNVFSFCAIFHRIEFVAFAAVRVHDDESHRLTI